MIYAALLITAVYGVLVLIHWRCVSAARAEADVLEHDMKNLQKAILTAHDKSSKA